MKPPSGTILNLDEKVYKTIEARRKRPIDKAFLYVYPDGLGLKRSWSGEVSNVSDLMAIGVNNKGYGKILGVVEGANEENSV